MKKPKLTPWFPADVKPARPGNYQRKYGSDFLDNSTDFWCGKYWWIGDKNLDMRSNVGRQWRGLANPPKATGAAPSTPSQKVVNE